MKETRTCQDDTTYTGSPFTVSTMARSLPDNDERMQIAGDMCVYLHLKNRFLRLLQCIAKTPVEVWLTYLVP